MRQGIDKIPRRDVNRAANVCLVSLTTRNLGYPYMKLHVALAASIAALALMACAKKDAEAPAADTAAPATTDSAADAATDAATMPADAAGDAAAPATEEAAPAAEEAAPAEPAPQQ